MLILNQTHRWLAPSRIAPGEIHRIAPFPDIYRTRADISRSFYRKVNGKSKNSKQGGEVPKEELNSSLCKLESLQQLHSRVSTWLMWVFGTSLHCLGRRRACSLLQPGLMWRNINDIKENPMQYAHWAQQWLKTKTKPNMGYMVFKPSRQGPKHPILLEVNPVTCWYVNCLNYFYAVWFVKT